MLQNSFLPDCSAQIQGWVSALVSLEYRAFPLSAGGSRSGFGIAAGSFYAAEDLSCGRPGTWATGLGSDLVFMTLEAIHNQLYVGFLQVFTQLKKPSTAQGSSHQARVLTVASVGGNAVSRVS